MRGDHDVECRTCERYADDPMLPPHDPAVAGHRAHCTCGRCF